MNGDAFGSYLDQQVPVQVAEVEGCDVEVFDVELADYEEWRQYEGLPELGEYDYTPSWCLWYARRADRKGTWGSGETQEEAAADALAI